MATTPPTKLDADPRITEGSTFFPALKDILRKIAAAVNPLID
jgi:hypothetical protein